MLYTKHMHQLIPVLHVMEIVSCLTPAITMWITIDQLVLLYDTSTKYSFYKKYCHQFWQMFPDALVQSRTVICESVKSIPAVVPVQDSTTASRRRILTEVKLGRMGARLETSLGRQLAWLAQKIFVAAHQHRLQEILLHFHPYNMTVVHISTMQTKKQDWILWTSSCSRDAW